MIAGALWSLAGAVAILWVAGSVLISLFRPWRMFDRDDRWLAWLLLLAWLPAAVAMGIELLLEARLDRRDRRAERGRRG